jgi:hypothetical protein
MDLLRLIARNVGAALWLLPVFLPAADAPSEPSPPPTTNTSLVVIIQDPEATEAFRPRLDRVRDMVNRGLTRYTGRPTVRDAWLSLLATQDIIGIKVHSAPGLSGTRPEVAGAIAESLLSAGVPKDHVVIWDKLQANLQSAGFVQVAHDLGIRVTSCQQEGYDESMAYTNFFLGHLMWTDHEFNTSGDEVGRRSFFSKLLTKGLTRIINVPPLMNHYRAGVTGCLFTLAMGSVDNTQRFESGAERLAEAVPEIYVQEQILDKVALNVVDGLLAQYEGQTHTLLHYAYPLNELRFSRDPVALDVLSLRELDAIRRTNSIPSPTNFVASYRKLYTENATLLELGTADLKQIRVDRP